MHGDVPAASVVPAGQRVTEPDGGDAQGGPLVPVRLAGEDGVNGLDEAAHDGLGGGGYWIGAHHDTEQSSDPDGSTRNV